MRISDWSSDVCSSDLGVEIFWLTPTIGAAALITRELIAAAAVLIAVIGVDDLVVDAIYFVRRFWRSATVYTRHDRIRADMLAPPDRPGAMATIGRASWRDRGVMYVEV